MQLRRALKTRDSVIHPALLSLLTALVLLFAIHTSLPDTRPSDSHLLMFRFDNPLPSNKLSNFLEHSDDVVGVCAVSLLNNDTGIVLLGVSEYDKTKTRLATSPLYEDPFQEDTPAIGYFQASTPLVSQAFTKDKGQMTLKIENRSFSFLGVPSNSYSAVPHHIPPGFGKRYDVSQNVKATLNSKSIHISDKEYADYLKELWRQSNDKSESSDDLSEYSDHVWGLPYERVMISLKDYVALNLPVLELYVSTAMPAEEALSEISKKLPAESWVLEIDRNDLANVTDHRRYVKMIERSLKEGIVPFYMLLLLSQMAIWGIWLDNYKPIITDSHRLGCSYLTQALALFLSQLLIVMFLFLISGTIFTQLYPALEKLNLLWRTNQSVYLLAFLSFIGVHSLYFIVWISSTVIRLRKGDRK